MGDGLNIIFQQENGFLGLFLFDNKYALLMRTANALQKVAEVGGNDAGFATMFTVSQLVSDDRDKVLAALNCGATLEQLEFYLCALIVDWATQTVTIGGEVSKKYSFADFIYVYAGDFPRTLADLKEMNIRYQEKVKAPTDEDAKGWVRRWFYPWDGDHPYAKDFITLEEAEHYAEYHEYEMFDLGKREAPFTRVYNRKKSI
jgi:hypothetical protein